MLVAMESVLARQSESREAYIESDEVVDRVEAAENRLRTAKRSTKKAMKLVKESKKLQKKLMKEGLRTWAVLEARKAHTAAALDLTAAEKALDDATPPSDEEAQEAIEEAERILEEAAVLSCACALQF